MDAHLVLVEWLDSSRCPADWTHAAEFVPPKPVRCRSVGWLIHQDTDSVVLTPNLGDEHCPENEQFCGALVIPACAVLSTVELGKPSAETGRSASP